MRGRLQNIKQQNNQNTKAITSGEMRTLSSSYPTPPFRLLVISLSLELSHASPPPRLLLPLYIPEGMAACLEEPGEPSE